MMSEPNPYGDGGNKLLAAIALIAMAGALWWVVQGGSSVDFGRWHAGVDEAKTAAYQSGKPIVVYFTASWCGPCETFKSQTLADERVAEYLEANFERAVVDLSDRFGPNNAVAAEHSVRMLPSVLVFDAHGRRFARMAAPMGPSELVSWLDSVRDEIRRDQERQATR